jgi:hypothetical protein
MHHISVILYMDIQFTGVTNLVTVHLYIVSITHPAASEAITSGGQVAFEK